MLSSTYSGSEWCSP